MAACHRHVVLYFDFISHNAFLAWHQLHRLAAKPGAKFSVQGVPTLFAGFLKQYDQVGPAEVPPKNWWMMVNVLRKASDMGLPPLQPPAVHPFNPLLALRVAGHDWGSHEANYHVTTSLFDAVWLESRNVMDADVVAESVTRGLSAASGANASCITSAVSATDVTELAQEPKAKARLAADTQHAIDHGAFGVPTMEVLPEGAPRPAPGALGEARGEIFFGFDDVGYMLRFLDDEDPIAGVDLEPWRHVKSRHRRR